MKLIKRHLRQHYTDYPFVELGDAAFYEAPIRPVVLNSFDGNKYVTIQVEGTTFSIKSGYIYTRPGRCGEVPRIHCETLKKLSEVSHD